MRRRLFSRKITEHIKSSIDETVQPGAVNGRSVSMGAGGQLDIVASTVTADGALGLHADGDLNLLSKDEHHFAYESRTVRKSGLFSNGGLSITLGSQSKTTISQSESALHHGSSVGSLAGDVLATAGGQYLQLSSELLTPQGDVHISAANVALRSAPNTTSVLNIMRQRQSGLTLSASHPVIDSLQTGVQMASLARRTDNGRYQAMALLTSGLSIYNAFTGLDKLGMPSVADGKATGGWTLSVGLSASSSSFERLTQTSTPVGPAITTGRNLSITATGTGPDAGDITLLGARLSAGGDATLRAARDITLAAAIGTSSETSRSRSSSGTVGVSLGAQGLSLTLAANRSNGWSNGWGTTYYNSEVGAAGRLGMDSGAHTTLQGAKASGQSVAMRVGSAGAGNLSISSPQDADHFIARESSSGFNVSIPIPGASLPGWIPNAGNGSFSFGINRSGMNLLADYEAVRQQTAINAGTGGFDITVAGHTHLKGGAITTEGTAAGSRLVTQSLSHETLLNRDVVEGRSQSVAVSVSNSATVGTLAGSAVGHARISTDQRSHTTSAVVGTVTQTRPDLLPQALANLRAAERAPLAARLADVQSRLNTLLASEPPKEPPPCYICDWEHPGGASVPVTPMSATQAGRAAALPADMGTALPTPPTASLRDGMAPTRPGGANVGAQTQSNGATWDAWNTQVQQLRTQQTQLQQRITAVDTKTYQTTVPLAANASALHQPLLHTFDRSKATQELKDGVAVTAAFGKAAFKAVGDEAGKRTKAKEIACKDGATSPACTAATTAAAGWEEGGTYKRILHGIVGAISGGQAGALAALTAEAAGPAIGRAIVAAGVAAGTPAYDALMLAARTAVGSGLGGSTGAAAAFNADANNRQLHVDQLDAVKQRAKQLAGVNGKSEYQWELELTAQLMRQNDQSFGFFPENSGARAMLADLQARTGFSMTAEGTADFYNSALNAEQLMTNASSYLAVGNLTLPSASVDVLTYSFAQAAWSEGFRNLSQAAQLQTLGQLSLYADQLVASNTATATQRAMADAAVRTAAAQARSSGALLQGSEPYPAERRMGQSVTDSMLGAAISRATAKKNADPVLGSAAQRVYTSSSPLSDKFPELAGVNPHYVLDAGVGVNTNCVSCVNAADARLSGKNPTAVAQPSGGYKHPKDLDPSIPFGFMTGETSVAQVKAELLAAGPGARGVVLIIQPGGIDHVINVVNRSGQVYFIDTQKGRVVNLRPDLNLKFGRP